ncbi:potassium transporter 5 [Quercus suber]|uniref:Potassium transporter 5 n=1 Tax=Quercus suber TaxID=58331 RepID=A0AAW0JMT5_QUESU
MHRNMEMSDGIVSDGIAEDKIEQSQEEEVSHQQLKAKKLSCHKLRRHDSLDIESNSVRGFHGHDSKTMAWKVILHLAFQSIGIVYGDIGTSPLYVFDSTFTKGINHNDDILGVLSMIFYTLTLIPLVKYVFVVLRANDNGDGGTFALYSLICRFAKVGLIPSQQAEDQEVSNFKLELPNNSLKRASWLKSKLENSQFAKFFLLFATMLGTSMVIGDGVLTPCISVLSAVGGIKKATSAVSDDIIVWISVAILICLFLIQRFGTDKVGYTFAPIICIWFAFIGGIGIFNFIKFDPTVVKALNPEYIIEYFQRNKKEAWVSLGGIVLAITGTEALFADVGHFTVRSIQISMCSVTYPTLVFAYTGQAAFLRKHNNLVGDTFFKSIPGIAVVFVMTLTSSFLVLIMIMIWKTHILLIISYVLVIGTVELVYLSSVLYKFDQGGYLPLAFAAVLMTIMFVWNDVYRRKYYYELDHKIPPDKLKEVVTGTNINQMPGLAIFYSELVQGIPPIFKHYVENVPALHSVLVFVSIKSLPISKVPAEERFLFRRVETKEHNVFRCVVRYGYSDVRNEHEPFEKMLIGMLKDFIANDVFWLSQNVLNNDENGGELDDGVIDGENENKDVKQVDEEKQREAIEKEIEAVDKACCAGVVHLFGENEVIARKGAGIGRRIIIDYAYNFLKRNLRQSDKVFNIPHKRMLKVGMTYEL